MSPRFIDDAEMTDLQPAHPSDREIDESFGRHDGKRQAHETRHRHRQCVGAVIGKRAQNIALGDDAGLSGAELFAGILCVRRYSSEEMRRRIIVEIATLKRASAAMNSAGPCITSRTRCRYG